MFRSQDIQVFAFLTIPWLTKTVTSWWILVHETRCIFELALLNHEPTSTYLHPPPPNFIHLHPAPFISTQLISASTQLSVTPSMLLEPKYRM